MIAKLINYLFAVRSALWFMLFTGVVVHMLCCTSLYIAITYMVKPQQESKNETFVPVCVKNSKNFNATIEAAKPVTAVM